MAYKMFAAIYVGSSEVAMKIYEINGRKSFKQVDRVSHFFELGKDTYRRGSLSNASIKQVCAILNEFKQKMKEYQANEYRAYATSAIREAANAELILDAIERNTGFKVQILSNSEQRYMNFKGLVAKYSNFHQVVSKNTAFVDVGAGSVQISLFDKNNISVTENIPIGTLRIRDYLSLVGNQSGRLDKLISEYVECDIVTFRNIYLNDKEIKNIVAVGEIVEAIRKMIPEIHKEEMISKTQFDYIYQNVVSSTPEELAEKYGIPYERATLMMPTIIIYQSFLNNCKAEDIFIPYVDFCDGITAAFMDEGSRIVFDHDFTEDILASAYNISKRYKCNRNHVDQVSDFALKIFDSVKKIHGMGKIERLQLQIAAILHECGNYINMHDGARNSYYIVANTEIVGLSHKERMEIANIVKYNIIYLPDYQSISSELVGSDYLTIAKLVAILRIANGLDKSHLQKIEKLDVAIKGDQLIISASTLEDIPLEAGLFKSRADFFETVYGIRPVLRLKRSV